MDPAVQNRVRELRQARNWTQEYLAETAGVSRQSINAIERQRYIPSLPLALTLARLFTCPLEQIFTLDRFPEAPTDPGVTTDHSEHPTEPPTRPPDPLNPAAPENPQ